MFFFYYHRQNSHLLIIMIKRAGLEKERGELEEALTIASRLVNSFLYCLICQIFYSMFDIHKNVPPRQEKAKVEANHLLRSSLEKCLTNSRRLGRSIKGLSTLLKQLCLG